MTEGVHKDPAQKAYQANRLEHDLARLARELSGFAEQLEILSEIEVKPNKDRAKINGSSQQYYVAIARQIYALRRAREAIFGVPDLFGEPAWDILLDLYIAQAAGKPISVTSACIASAVPATTGLRWLSALSTQGLVVRENDAADNRRVFVRLSNAGIDAVERVLDTIELDLQQRPPKQPFPA